MVPLESPTRKQRMVLVPKVLVLRTEAQREAERQFPFERREVGCDRQKSNPTDGPMTAHDGAAPFPNRDVAEVGGSHFVDMSVQLERRVLEFRPEVNRDFDILSLNLEQILLVAVPNASGSFARRLGNHEPFVVCGTDVIDPFLCPDLPFSADSDLGDDDHDLRNFRGVYIPSVCLVRHSWGPKVFCALSRVGSKGFTN